ncbi:hypothetical protein BG011_001827 [Mortierella polycephala]|uniref:MIT domain-containing protein n=1 Tax=Mortierella polycephala TaxID=41804 RepID=A0A9P6Q4M0_9FUNG|nr:hypothetical protein BG011_001827 [Mortierella polycephala]
MNQSSRSNNHGGDSQSHTQQQQDGWRSIFDAALVKAQQAVKLDELDETALAANLYAQAANDLGRVIPMCKSEKKMQSMQAIQAIYLDRVAQLKAGVSSRAAKKKIASSTSSTSSPSPSSSVVTLPSSSPYTENAHRQEDQYLSPENHREIGSQLFGKKRSNTQPSGPYPPPLSSLESHRGNEYAYSDYSSANNVSNNNGYISPPYSNPASSSSPPLQASPIFKAYTPPPSNSNKPLRWKPFGKKKSKSFSVEAAPDDHEGNHSTPSGPNQPPYAYEHTNFVNPADRADVYSQQQHTEWTTGQEQSALVLQDYEHHTRHFDDDEGDTEPYYIADVKGRAQAFEGNINSSVPIAPKENSKKKSRTKPTLKQNSSSYPDKQSLISSFAPGSILQQQDNVASSVDMTVYYAQEQHMATPDGQTYTANYQEGYEYEYLYQTSGQKDQEYFQDPLAQPQYWPHGYEQDIQGVSQRQEGGAEQETKDGENTKTKSKWFSKKKKKDESAPAEMFDGVAKLMDEALFGSGSAMVRKKKNKKKVPISSPTLIEPPEIFPRNDPPTENDELAAHGNLDHRRPQLTLESGSFALASTDTYSPMPLSPQTPQTPKTLQPVAYAPRTKYTPSPKKQLKQAEAAVLTPLIIPDATSQTSIHPQQMQEESDVNGDGLEATGATLELPKKSKGRSFNMFKTKKSNTKASMDPERTPLSPTFMQGLFGEDSKPSLAEKMEKSMVDHTAPDAALSTIDSKKRESDEYVPYEYREDIEGPLMERVEIPTDREIVGFVMPINEGDECDLDGNVGSSTENWDSWVSQLETFEKVLSDKGMSKEKIKQAKWTQEEKAMEEMALRLSSSSPSSSLRANRSSMFSVSTGRPSTSTTYDWRDNGRPLSMEEDSDRFARQFSSQSGGIIEQDLAVQQLSAQQVNERWRNTNHKEAMSHYRASDAFSVSEQDQERYLATLLRNNEGQLEDNGGQNTDQQAVSNEEVDREREEALTALLETSMAIMALPVPKLNSASSSLASAQGIPSASHQEEPKADSRSVNIQESKDTGADANEEDQEVVSTSQLKVKAKVKSSKPKLLPISTPLSQLLQLSNAEELWKYVQQAKTYATNKMNKGDKRSAAIALKRAQALEARWQEVLLEMASSDEGEDGLLDDDEDNEDNESGEEEEEEEEATRKTKVILIEENTKNSSAETTKSVEATMSKEEQHILPVTPLPTTMLKSEEGDGVEADEERRQMVTRKETSRSDSAPDMYSKYKNNKSAPAFVSKGSTANQADDGQQDADETLEQMLETSDVEHLRRYIQRLKSDTVAKARSGSKFAALQGMKNVKALQQRLDELEKDTNQDKAEDTEQCIEEKKDDSATNADVA